MSNFLAAVVRIYHAVAKVLKISVKSDGTIDTKVELTPEQKNEVANLKAVADALDSLKK